MSGSAAAATKAPTVTKQPVSTTVEVGQSVTFTGAASESPKPTVHRAVGCFDQRRRLGPAAGGHDRPNL
jgi:hypothetical protein